MTSPSSGVLTIVGTGIHIGQMTDEARSCIERSDKILFLLADPISYGWILGVRPDAESLHRFYDEEKPRRESYLAMVDRILTCVREGSHVCVVSYGHPGVFAFPTHEAIRQARLEGFPAKMLPGVSAEDCLFADLGVDPGQAGCQSFEATDFLVYRRRFDPRSALILWQIGVIGQLGYKRTFDLSGVGVLVEVLSHSYERMHDVVVYEAAFHPIIPPRIQRIPLGRLTEATITPITTLYVPPTAVPDVDVAMLERLGLPRSMRSR
jgi:precorrin-6B methylase 1